MDASAIAPVRAPAREQVTDGGPASGGRGGDAPGPPTATVRREVAPRETAPLAPGTTGDWAICCSGGGIGTRACLRGCVLTHEHPCACVLTHEH